MSKRKKHKNRSEVTVWPKTFRGGLVLPLPTLDLYDRSWRDRGGYARVLDSSGNSKQYTYPSKRG